jgi:hypothetical protein
MTSLSARRPVFHSEADFQFAFAQAVKEAAPEIEVRLEVRQSVERAEYVDLACSSARQRTLIELKYPTAGWIGTDGNGEAYVVRNHAAHDLARRYFIHDIRRLERFTSDQASTDGIAIMLTNEHNLWSPPGSRTTRDINFRIHDGRTLAGGLVWGTGDTPRYDQRLSGSYTARWSDYSTVDGPSGRFRWLAFGISST